MVRHLPGSRHDAVGPVIAGAGVRAPPDPGAVTVPGHDPARRRPSGSMWATRHPALQTGIVDHHSLLRIASPGLGVVADGLRVESENFGWPMIAFCPGLTATARMRGR